MIDKISVTFGSQAVLNQIIKRYPKRQLALFAGISGTSGVQLIDYSGKSPIFVTPITYRVVDHSGTDDWHDYLNIIQVTPDEQHRKVLNSRASDFISNPHQPNGLQSVYYLKAENNQDQKILLTTWKSEFDCLAWKKTAAAAFITYQNFKNDFTVDYHDSSYQALEQKQNI
ncbi:hypothetical protein B808_1056 [Fructilactobacillus florum 8D]|uniref:ABM domain-containing protein n=1 Tax=Fructilactobacillus florum 8D TaxID=1221538 RepID=W9ECW3_9LACO|nr:hypothetical protein [Fructilactobacillus florum]EKK20338.1 hypothetical protein B807_977 [Fructilactobacillus florum 2F]ETO39948.1 hypothetical protein B808_1056 [Fructilactobacillus florum 8D]